MTERISECPFWSSGYKAEGTYFPATGEIRVDYSARTDGGYVIPNLTVHRLINDLSDRHKAWLTTWLIDQRGQGIGQPKISKEIVDHVKRNGSLPVHERAESLLPFIAHRTEIVGTYIKVSNSDRYDVATNAAYASAHACSESTTWDEVEYYFIYLLTKNWLKITFLVDQDISCMVTVDGYIQIARQSTNTLSSQAFVAMWFHDDTNGVYENGIKPGIEAAGYEAVRIDQKDDATKIDDDIIAEIRRSRFVLADFTHGRDGARGGLYFESGFALGLGIPVIHACRKDMKDKLHFDTRQYSHILWDDPADLKDALVKRIGARIGNGPGKNASSTLFP